MHLWSRVACVLSRGLRYAVVNAFALAAQPCVKPDAPEAAGFFAGVRAGAPVNTTLCGPGALRDDLCELAIRRSEREQ